MFLLLIYLLIPLQAQTCPQAENETHQFIEVDLYPDLVAMGAKIENIPNLELHQVDRQKFPKHKLNIYYRLWKPFDPDKETLVFVLGGPGQYNDFMDIWVPRYEPKINDYNIVMMDHRIVGCSRQMFQDHMPASAYKMRFAAADLEMIRRELQGTKAWHVDGGSYGSELALTYALLFPQSVDKLMIWGVYSSHLDVRLARRTFISRLLDLFPTLNMQFRELDSYDPNLVGYFLRYSFNMMYSATDRVKIPTTMELVLGLLRKGETEKARALLPDEKVWQAPYMANAILCLELEPYPAMRGEFAFYSALDACASFRGYFDYFDYTESLSFIKNRTLFWQGDLDPLYHPDAALLIAEKLQNDFSFLVPGQGHGISNLRECYNDIYFAFLDGADNSRLKELSEKDYCLINQIR
jgi:pimeloyl-ACP methyl ester carboxylesterase